MYTIYLFWRFKAQKQKYHSLHQLDCHWSGHLDEVEMNFEMSEEEMKVLLYVTGAGLVTPVVGVTVANTTLDPGH